MKHDLIKTGDADSSHAIQDRNGEVVLAYCRRCRKGEGELEKSCPGNRYTRVLAVLDAIGYVDSTSDGIARTEHVDRLVAAVLGEGQPLKDWPGEFLQRDKDVPEPSEGSAWIQWKGTEVCMDVHCRCGEHGHVDASFAYFYLCRGCGEKYAVGQVVRLYRLTPECAKKHGEHAVEALPEEGH